MVKDGLKWRIIPAYAGSTSAGRGKALRPSDHPRIRGEHGDIGMRGVDGVGSSPHTRGAPMRRPARPTPTRIIPAYAGSTGGNKCR